MASQPQNGKANGHGGEAQRACVFKRPDVNEVRLQAAKVGLPEGEAERFMAYFDSNGWKVGRNPMRSWRGALTTWRMNWEERRNGTRSLNLRDTSSSPTQGF